MSDAQPLASTVGTGDPVTIVNLQTSELCMTVEGGSDEPGSRLVSGSCEAAADQQFTTRSSGEIRVFGDLCVTAFGSRGKLGSPLIVRECHGRSSQKWTITPSGQIQGSNGKCIDIRGPGDRAGSFLVRMPCNGTASQKWDLRAVHVSDEPTPPVTPSPPDDGIESSPGSPAELPRAYIDTRYTAPTGDIIEVPAGGDLQKALDAAQPGDQVVLAAGATYTGNFVLPEKDGSGWIVVRSSAMDRLPDEGVRVSPDDAPNMPRIVSHNVHRALTAAPGASHYRVVGLEITVDRDVSKTYSIVNVAPGSQNIILDRVYVHGRPDLDFQQCVVLNGTRAAVIHSYISGCHSSGFDSQAILVWNTPGPLKIVNNYLEGAGENVLIGGAKPADGVVPSDIEIRYNHFKKPLSWKESGRWVVKNLLEIKFGRRILVEDNVFENNWKDGQTGYAIVLKHATQGQDWSWTVSEDITFRSNRVTGTRSGISLSSRAESPVTRKLLIENNYFEVEHHAILGIDGVQDAYFVRNTFVAGPGIGTYDNMVVLDAGGLPGLVMKGNVLGLAHYGVGPSDPSRIDYLDNRAPGWEVADNAFVGETCGYYPDGNICPAVLEGVPDGYGMDVGSLSAVVAGLAP